MVQVEAVQGTQNTFVRKTNTVKGFRFITADDVCNFQLKFTSHKNNLCFANETIVAWVSWIVGDLYLSVDLLFHPSLLIRLQPL